MALTIRSATVQDVPTLWAMLKELADYEDLLPHFTITPEVLGGVLFPSEGNRSPDTLAVVAMDNSEPVGMVMYRYTCATFTGARGLYVEDFFVLKAHRGKGYGKDLMAYMATLATHNGCGHISWQCKADNSEAQQFYKKMGATPMPHWVAHRLDNAAMQHLVVQP